MRLTVRKCVSRTLGFGTVLLLLLSGLLQSRAEVPDPDPSRFAEEIEEFALHDRKNSVPNDGILFVGSSSIRLWETASAFPDHAVINRGFGGSHISDINFYYEHVVKPYRPSMVIFYAGDNDIADGKSPAQLLEDFQEFSRRVRADRSDTSILFLSIKPSIARWNFWPVMAEANALMRAFASGQENVRYVDVASPLLDENGRPRDVYLEDGLHLRQSGYRLWNETLKPLLP